MSRRRPRHLPNMNVRRSGVQESKIYAGKPPTTACQKFAVMRSCPLFVSVKWLWVLLDEPSSRTDKTDS